MRLPAGARVAVIGAGPSGLTAAKHALQAGFDVSVFEASGAVGGQWQTTAARSGVWPGMHTNTSRAMTAFSDFPAPAGHPLHPAAEQVQAYLWDYAQAFGVLDRIRFGARVADVRPGWTVDGERFDAVVAASGRFRTPRPPPVAGAFAGEVIHAFSYPGADAFRGRRTLVYGNGISGLEIASDLAPQAQVVSAFRKPRYVIQKVVGGVSSDWQWYTLFGAIERRLLPGDEWSRRQRERIERVAGNPAGFGAPEPGPGRARGRRVAVPGLPAAGARRQRGLPARHRVDPGAGGHLRRRLGGDGRRDDLRDRIRPRRPLPEREPVPPLPADLPPGPARARRGGSVPGAGAVLPAARAPGALDRRRVERRGVSAGRAGHAGRLAIGSPGPARRRMRARCSCGSSPPRRGRPSIPPTSKRSTASAGTPRRRRSRSG